MQGWQHTGFLDTVEMIREEQGWTDDTVGRLAIGYLATLGDGTRASFVDALREQQAEENAASATVEHYWHHGPLGTYCTRCGAMLTQGADARSQRQCPAED